MSVGPAALRAVAHQKPHDLEMPCECRMVQGYSPVDIGRLHVPTGLQQRLHRRRHAIFGSVVERGPAVLVLFIGIGPPCEELPHTPPVHVVRVGAIEGIDSGTLTTVHPAEPRHALRRTPAKLCAGNSPPLPQCVFAECPLA